MRLKAYQMPKHCTAVYKRSQTGVYNSTKLSRQQIFDLLLQSKNTLFKLQCCPPGMCACVYLAGHSSAMPNDVALQQKLSQVTFFCRMTLCFLANCDAGPASFK